MTSQTVFTSDATAIATVNGMFSQMMNDPNQFTSSLTTLYTGLCADELSTYTPNNLDEFKLNKISVANHALLQAGFWQPAYKYIYTSNLILEGLGSAGSVTQAVKDQLTGEAKFVRAFCYFYLVNLFGDVPLVTSSSFIENAVLPRAPKKIIYTSVINDLQEAQELLPSDYPVGEKTRPNKWAATTLLARAYLYIDEWQKAEEQARKVLNSGNYSLPPLQSVFLKNSPEAIWQLQPVNPDLNTYEGWMILPATETTPPTYVLTAELEGAFEPGDQRKALWDTVRLYNGSSLHVPYKYKINAYGAPVMEYYTVLRLAEVYLIHAEAKAHLGEITDALSDLNTVRRRAGLSDVRTNSADDLLKAIEAERRIELFAEWGHRWMDLKRTGKADEVLGSLKPTWKPNAILWPIPQGEINLNSQLSQNPGY